MWIGKMLGCNQQVHGAEDRSLEALLDYAHGGGQVTGRDVDALVQLSVDLRRDLQAPSGQARIPTSASIPTYYHACYQELSESDEEVDSYIPEGFSGSKGDHGGAIFVDLQGVEGENEQEDAIEEQHTDVEDEAGDEYRDSYVRAIYDGRENTYSFDWNGRRLRLLSQAANLLIRPNDMKSAMHIISDQNELKSLYCGAVICKVCQFSFAPLRSNASLILIIDTDVMLHQFALFENPSINNVVVLSEVLEDVISRNMAVYYRIKALCTNAMKNFFVFYSENHRDAYVEEKVEKICNFVKHFLWLIKKIFLFLVESYVRSLQQPNLLDLIAIPTNLNILKGELNDLRLSKREVIYPEHKLASVITSGLLHVLYHKGRFRVNRYNPLVSYVRSRSIGNRVNINKAFGGDIVAAELLCPQYQRTEENSLIVEDVNGNVDDAPRNANIAKAWAGSRPNVFTLLIWPCHWYYKEKLELMDAKTHDSLDIGKQLLLILLLTDCLQPL
ncbi:hypothetical protein KFK09_019619 [Dendrobium nobile]|uniref:Uncharacterized protein n=1 Tax=Dendrobium nobile TaxID=94219 RepID=A0A8T3ARG4_DENNO|nr:hypothetical protein KFK09_019619 [Dendrobium nobile]